ncbi:YunG family protein [Metabacillus indicus]|uniref:YunG family protein n=1 Tax=Metabacillus indicus TaxID=246786 RepID=UPI003CD0CB69
MSAEDLKLLRCALLNSWSLNSSSKWTPENPANGQCGVTALVVHDLLGGEIKKTCAAEGWHFYNEIDSVRVDFTASQFEGDVQYDDLPSSREEAFADTNQLQYDDLKKKVVAELERMDSYPIILENKFTG